MSARWRVGVVTLLVAVSIAAAFFVVSREPARSAPSVYAERIANGFRALPGVEVVGLEEPAECDRCVVVVGSYSFAGTRKRFIVFVGRQDLPIDANPIDFDAGERIAAGYLKRPVGRISIDNGGVGVGLATANERGPTSEQELSIMSQMRSVIRGALDEDRREFFGRP